MDHGENLNWVICGLARSDCTYLYFLPCWVWAERPRAHHSLGIFSRRLRSRTIAEASALLAASFWSSFAFFLSFLSIFWYCCYWCWKLSFDYLYCLVNFLHCQLKYHRRIDFELLELDVGSGCLSTAQLWGNCWCQNFDFYYFWDWRPFYLFVSPSCSHWCLHWILHSRPPSFEESCFSFVWRISAHETSPGRIFGFQRMLGFRSSACRTVGDPGGTCGAPHRSISICPFATRWSYLDWTDFGSPSFAFAAHSAANGL